MTDQELQQNYPTYSQSIFTDFYPDDPEVLGWQQNVLDKIKGNSILPHYIQKDKDFDTFWGWITHFFAIIVVFCREFKKIFDFESYSNSYLYDNSNNQLFDVNNDELVVAGGEEYYDELREFMREKDYIQDSRVQINNDLIVPLYGELYSKILCNYKLLNDGSMVIAYDEHSYVTDFLSVDRGSIVTLKLLGYTINTNPHLPVNNIKIICYDINKNMIDIAIDDMNLSSEQAIAGYRLQLPNSGLYNYIRVSYKVGNNYNIIPLYLGIFLEGEGNSFVTNRSIEDIFGVHSDFRKRGTFKGSSLIKKVLESKKEDNFYAEYLNQVNTGWFLNRNSPTFKRLYKSIKINAFSVDDVEYDRNNGQNIYVLKEQYFLLNQNTSIVVNWDERFIVNSVEFLINIYDKEKNLLTDVPIYSAWTIDGQYGENVITSDNVPNPILYTNKRNFVELPIELIDSPRNAKFSVETYAGVENFNGNIYLFCKNNFNNSHQAYYLKIDKIILHAEEARYEELPSLILDINIDLYLRQLPITLGFLGIKQYYICCFKNNGSYTNDEAEEIIDKKILPYNGYRIFIDNLFYKNVVNIALSLEDVYFDKIYKIIHLKIRGGVPSYSYQYDREQSISSNLQTYEKGPIAKVDYGLHNIKVTDSLGNSILVPISCLPYASLNYKFKLYVGQDNSIQVFIKVFGGTETSYNLFKLEEYGSYLSSEISIPPNTWIDITNIVGNNFHEITNDTYLYIIDNGIPVNIEVRDWLINEYDEYYYIKLNLFDLFKNFGVDIYDDGEGELVD